MADQKKDERTATQRIADILQAETEARTLSLEAVDAIQTIRDDHVDALRLIEMQEETIEKEKLCSEELEGRFNALSIKYKDLVEVNAAHEERAVELAGARQLVDVQSARLEAHLEALDRQDDTLRILFRAPTVRRNIARTETGTEPDAAAGYSGATVGTSKSVTETEETTEG